MLVEIKDIKNEFGYLKDLWLLEDGEYMFIVDSDGMFSCIGYRKEGVSIVLDDVDKDDWENMSDYDILENIMDNYIEGDCEIKLFMIK